MFEKIYQSQRDSALAYIRQEHPEESDQQAEEHARALVAFKVLIYSLKTGDTSCIK